MLVLTRRVGETIVIGDDVRVTVLGIRGQQTKLGISALPHIPIYREELKPEATNPDNRAPRAPAQQRDAAQQALI